MEPNSAVRVYFDTHFFKGCEAYFPVNSLLLRRSYLILLIFCSLPTVAQLELAATDIYDLSIEELLTVDIVTATKKIENITRVPAAIHVITAEDIRRSGATSIPEALRLAPGVNVAKIDGNKWAVSIRGFNSRTANKQLVLVDGRSIYDPLFSGVLWETKAVALEDVDRIEIVRGPGGTLWGANAVNGVINIITKSAKDTQGGLGVLTAGTNPKVNAYMRAGVEIDSRQYLRVYVRSTNRAEGFIDGQSPDDDSTLGQLGFRYDFDVDERNGFTLQGDAYSGRFGTANSQISPDTETDGFNLLGKWHHTASNGTNSNIQVYIDRSELDAPALGEKRNTIDVSADQHLKPLGFHSLTWGWQYRYSEDKITNTPVLQVVPDRRSDETFSAFFDDRIELSPDKWYFSFGTKWEENDYTGSEIQPNVRLSWHIDMDNLWWASVSRAVRIPSRLESDFALPNNGQIILGGRNAEAEELIAYETGLRMRSSANSYLDLAAFYHRYDDLFTIEGLTTANKADGRGYGVEVLWTYSLSSQWRFISGYSWLDMDLQLDSDSVSNPASLENIEGNSPRHQLFIRLSHNLTSDITLDAVYRYIDELSTGSIDQYSALDFSLSKRFSDQWEFMLVGQNWLDRYHPEFSNSLATQVESSIYAKIHYRF